MANNYVCSDVNNQHEWLSYIFLSRVLNKYYLTKVVHIYPYIANFIYLTGYEPTLMYTIAFNGNNESDLILASP